MIKLFPFSDYLLKNFQKLQYSKDHYYLKRDFKQTILELVTKFPNIAPHSQFDKNLIMRQINNLTELDNE